MHNFYQRYDWFFMFGQEDERKKEEKDERKRKYNVRWNDEVFLLLFNCCWAITCEFLDLVNFFSIVFLHHVMPFVGYCWGDGGISDEKNTSWWSHEGFSALMLSQTCLLAGFCELGTLNLGYWLSKQTWYHFLNLLLLGFYELFVMIFV